MSLNETASNDGSKGLCARQPECILLGTKGSEENREARGFMSDQSDQIARLEERIGELELYVEQMDGALGAVGGMVTLQALSMDNTTVVEFMATLIEKYIALSDDAELQEFRDSFGQDRIEIPENVRLGMITAIAWTLHVLHEERVQPEGEAESPEGEAAARTSKELAILTSKAKKVATKLKWVILPLYTLWKTLADD